MANLGLVTSILWVDFQLESHVHLDSITHYVQNSLYLYMEGLVAKVYAKKTCYNETRVWHVLKYRQHSHFNNYHSMGGPMRSLKEIENLHSDLL